jgi:hypothetical protein
MKKNIFILLTSIMFLATGIASVYAENASTAKPEVKALEKTAECCGDGNKSCCDKDKCVCKECKTAGKCDTKCECCVNCKDGKMKCRDMKGCDGKKAEGMKKSDCGSAQGCGAQTKSGCGMMKK